MDGEVCYTDESLIYAARGEQERSVDAELD